MSFELQAFLQAFEKDLSNRAVARESVTVDVQRRSGFSNHATTRRGLSIELDEPAEFGGTGRSPDPAEQLLAAIGASVSVTLTAHAALRGIAVDDVRLVLGADIDAAAFFHPGSKRPTGLLDMTLSLNVVSSAPERVVRAVVRDALRVAPVLRSLKRMPRIALVVEKTGSLATERA